MRLRRFKDHKATHHHRAVKLMLPHPAIVNGKTLFPSRVKDVTNEVDVLKWGYHSRKLGGWVTKGPWKDMPIFSLTLEERATCPADCLHWRDCYGNKMNYAPRFKHGTELEVQLDRELAVRSQQYPKGFVVRLHVLGDFYSVDYVRFWAGRLASFPRLHVFGYTGWQPRTDIGREIDKWRDYFGQRFSVRHSNGPLDTFRTVTVRPMPAQGLFLDKTPAVMNGAIVCPVQTGKTECCGTCGLCWTTPRPIAFIGH